MFALSWIINFDLLACSEATLWVILGKTHIEVLFFFSFPLVFVL